MNRTRTLLTATVLATAGLAAACTGSDPMTDPAQNTARPVIEQPDTSGPARALNDHLLRESVRDFAPWLLATS